MTDTGPAKKSDLGVRTLSAVVMVAVAGTALWLGGWAWIAFVAAVALGVLWEWWGLVRGFARSRAGLAAWSMGGLIYIGLAAANFALLRNNGVNGLTLLCIILFGVVGTDIGAYTAGRAIGGPKIAPSISPSKTWAGLAGGAFFAAFFIFVSMWVWVSGLCQTYYDFVDRPLPSGWFLLDDRCNLPVPRLAHVWLFLLLGVLLAIVAQAGDFFESWMKRRAGVKDSGNLIPGHGGLFDRVDGLLAVTFVLGLVKAVSLSL